MLGWAQPCGDGWRPVDLLYTILHILRDEYPYASDRICFLCKIIGVFLSQFCFSFEYLATKYFSPHPPPLHFCFVHECICVPSSLSPFHQINAIPDFCHGWWTPPIHTVMDSGGLWWAVTSVGGGGQPITSQPRQCPIMMCSWAAVASTHVDLGLSLCQHSGSDSTNNQRLITTNTHAAQWWVEKKDRDIGCGLSVSLSLDCPSHCCNQALCCTFHYWEA